MASALTDVLDQLLVTPGLQGLGYKITASYSSGTSEATTSTAEMTRGGADALSTRFDGGFLLDPGGASADQIRQITNVSVSSGVATITTAGPNYGATRNSETMYVLSKDPQTILDLANDALAENFVPCPIPLAHGPTNYHGQDSSAATGWPDSSNLNGAPSIVTTAAQVFSGAQSINVLNDAANGYSASPLLEGPLNGKGLAWFIARDDSGGGATLGIYDQDSNLIDSVDFTNEAWVYGRKEFQLGTADRGVILRRQGTGTTEQVDWQTSAVVWYDQPIFHLRDTGWIDEPFEFQGLSRAIFHAAAYEQDTWLASSMELVKLEEGRDFRYTSLLADANPGILWVNPTYLSDPLFMWIKCPWSAPYGVSTTFTAWTSSTDCPLKLLVGTLTFKLGELYPQDFPDAMRIGQREMQAQRHARVQKQPTSTYTWSGPTGRRVR